ncbi:glycosylphosphatidylinositol anchor biosynthesis [Pichia californica]|uniref:Mannosyltransferase n=1 Tax=Pichia californica TaxID=460514 RepID=A0A9P6WMZ6_9ASCO|nr:glycosylphosphatidylinositol anchor biosynthesis [[Candida] californica]KAG0689969.1 glycosylphosphatidylinositol anchor biosynthesis [[Candida] californica]
MDFRDNNWLTGVLEKTPVPSFLFILAWRLVNALTIRTFFQADEYWQVLEPAHKAIFGYGYLTWEWDYGLRSYLHPLLYMLPYWITKSLNLDPDTEYAYVLIGPRIVNALVSSIGDYYLYHLINKKLNDKKLAKLVSYMSLLSAWNWYCWCRSFANSIELSLTIVSLYYLNCNQVLRCLVISAISCLIRPTNAIVWLYYLLPVFWKRPIYIFFAIIIGSFIIGLDSVLNCTFYSTWKVPLWSFFKFNISDSLSSFYGTSRLDFYFFQAIPILLLNYLPFFINGVIYTSIPDFSGLLIIYILVFTLIPHKEFRFIYPMMPVLITYSAYGLLNISTKVSNKVMKLIIILTILTSSLLSYYFTQIHEIGELQLPIVIRQHIINENNDNTISIGFLTPCHSTPFQSHFHLSEERVNIWFLTCEPPLPSNILLGSTVDTYMDESDYFYENPLLFLQSNFPALNGSSDIPIDSVWPHDWPQYIVMFETLWKNENSHVKEYIEKEYNIVEKLWNAPGHWDSRREGNLLILKRN